MWYILSFIAGGIFSVVFMCLFQLSGPESRAEEKLYGIQTETGGFDEQKQ